MVFHVQLAVRNWLVCQLDIGETEYLPPPDFCQGLNMLEVQNNLMWLPTVTNGPALLALCVVTRASARTSNSDNRTPASGTTDSALGEAVASATPRRDAGAQVRNPNRDARFMGNTPLARLVRSRSVGLAITTAGSDPPQVSRNGVTIQHCVSWHARGQCFEFCERCADHIPMQSEEATAFHAWAALAYA
jgi:hypothetical protein